MLAANINKKVATYALKLNNQYGMFPSAKGGSKLRIRSNIVAGTPVLCNITRTLLACSPTIILPPLRFASFTKFFVFSINCLLFLSLYLNYLMINLINC